MSVFLTGDTHIPIDISKLNIFNFPEQRSLNYDDYVIVLGDFGLLWKNNEEYEWWKNWFGEKNFTTLWLDGNHENHDWIDTLPISEWNSGKVHRISENIIHLMRGQVYTFYNKTFFVFGGAQSHDIERRTPGISWWAREQGSPEEQKEALHNLSLYNFKVDYILTHTCPQEITKNYFGYKDTTITGEFLNRIYHTIQFKDWYFGHLHKDIDINTFHALFKTIRKII